MGDHGCFSGERMENDHHKYLRTTFEAAQKARKKGNHPFGAVLVDEHGDILTVAENTVVSDMDPTGHAEINLVREASRQFDREFLEKCTLYTSTEPCPMCAGAIFWGNVKKVVFGLSEKSFYEMIGFESEDVLYLPCRDVFSKGKKAIEVIGPLLEVEAREVHKGFWRAD